MTIITRIEYLVFIWYSVSVYINTETFYGIYTGSEVRKPYLRKIRSFFVIIYKITNTDILVHFSAHIYCKPLHIHTNILEHLK